MLSPLASCPPWGQFSCAGRPELWRPLGTDAQPAPPTQQNCKHTHTEDKSTHCDMWHVHTLKYFVKIYLNTTPQSHHVKRMAVFERQRARKGEKMSHLWGKGLQHKKSAIIYWPSCGSKPLWLWAKQEIYCIQFYCMVKS